jgi:hypothetical protein
MNRRSQMGGKTRSISTAEEFWPRVEARSPTECWPYLRVIGKGGYGTILWSGRWTHAHRVALMLTAGEPTPEQPWALHHCDNPPCCNPAHLMWGTAKENHEQMWSRGRGVRHGQKGELNVKAKLAEQDVRMIRELYPAWTLKQIASQFGVSFSTIQRIVTKQYWPHVK